VADSNSNKPSHRIQYRHYCPHLYPHTHTHTCTRMHRWRVTAYVALEKLFTLHSCSPLDGFTLFLPPFLMSPQSILSPLLLLTCCLTCAGLSDARLCARNMERVGGSKSSFRCWKGSQRVSSLGSKCAQLEGAPRVLINVLSILCLASRSVY
jgi:hypothetical protein